MASQGVAVVRNIRELTAVFDRDRFGLNVRVGVWYFAAQVITNFTWMIAPLIQGQGVGWNPLPYYVLLLVANALEAAAFVVVVHHVREVGSLAAAWGGVSVVVGAVFRVAIRLLAFEGFSAGGTFDPLMLGSNFVSGALFILGLGVAVRSWGVAPWSLIVGAAAGGAVSTLIFQIAWSLTRAADAFAGSFLIPAAIGGAIGGAISGAVVGGLVYAGVAAHMRSPAVAGRLATASRAGGKPAEASAAAVGVPSIAAAPVAGPPVPAGLASTMPAAVKPSAPSGRQHHFVCCANPSVIAAFMEVYGVARAAGWGEYRRLRASVFGAAFQEAQRKAAGALTPFPGKEYMGEQSAETTTLDHVLRQIQAAEASGTVHVAHGASSPLHGAWMKSTYETLVGEALKQGILPFRMYVTESDAAAAELMAALDEPEVL